MKSTNGPKPHAYLLRRKEKGEGTAEGCSAAISWYGKEKAFLFMPVDEDHGLKGGVVSCGRFESITTSCCGPFTSSLSARSVSSISCKLHRRLPLSGIKTSFYELDMGHGIRKTRHGVA
ncbi:hypothetical protein B296_00057626 [Ensete ventricosum]|uniref:Uncharacterized protein n=1 Tax=Ensete ventricosum TaxID=4639 RepID=A0A426X468_ENSVE|nr:hypothetical protein B296_00057626 [Ensete ventricosum]